ncbi:hypothetical protein [Agrococcus sp. Marseille-Q4369]|uniref:hypothetical protein n=1 Tax=Agrococcus sp. Marseille-Q4369 TaxID=2810513 RepID=UPI001B8B3D17|nr:hypothetical protein [Agrococcus sp. Marseille-Q4369]QUW18875.1 hypothetical protein JSQ78_00365 [Agrococcus sp. Marseille-Q4369]
MSTITERPCIRGCTLRGEHFATCLDRDGQPTEGCKGCVPAPARDGVLLCNRCWGRSLGALYDAPDLVGAIRARANPLKAQVFDKVLVSGSRIEGIPAPVNADFIEAADALTRGLQGWARFIEPASVPARRGLRAGAEADEAREIVLEATTVILDALPTLANDAVQIVELCRYLLDEIPGEHDDECLARGGGRPAPGCTGCKVDREWTVRAALAKWPLVERAWFAAQPCPYCSLRTVRVTPARRLKDDTVYECQGCQWTRTDADDDGPWPLVFSRRSGESLR